MGPVDRLILGTNPLNGVNHVSAKAGRETFMKLDVDKTIEIMQAAFEGGATAVNLSPTTRIYDAFEKMKAQGYDGRFGVYLMLPDMERFRKAMLTGGPMSVARELVSGTGWAEKLSTTAQGVFALVTGDVSRIVRKYIDIELNRIRRVLPARAEVVCVLVHEQVSDLALGLRSDALLAEFVSAVSERGLRPGFVTRNFPLFVRFLSDSGMRTREVVMMTPFNKLGFQMSPSREECEEALNKYDFSSVIAMSVLGGGQIGLRDAADYLKKLGRIRSVVVGVSSIIHARDTFTYLGKVMDTLSTANEGA